ncbi:uncharacterized protein CTRU02_204056 [Colletotrichum truncatum]|uniref:Uncharacterized protein n=1 Tax=Colletotrichum truncatum TaxID=5467 RepID=A0ACC3ZAW3_COLTU|nr:uncharacterized protein CTRU02_13651 [Colletotrichum truncatum]KAF6783184.1 hypothetical protein CTRU02_13651 [Colletotrichum truncatum]
MKPSSILATTVAFALAGTASAGSQFAYTDPASIQSYEDLPECFRLCFKINLQVEPPIDMKEKLRICRWRGWHKVAHPAIHAKHMWEDQECIHYMCNPRGVRDMMRTEVMKAYCKVWSLFRAPSTPEAGEFGGF